MGSLRVLQLPPAVQTRVVSGVRLTGDSKLPMSSNGCLFFCISHGSDWPHLLPYGIWAPAPPLCRRKWMDPFIGVRFVAVCVESYNFSLMNSPKNVFQPYLQSLPRCVWNIHLIMWLLKCIAPKMLPVHTFPCVEQSLSTFFILQPLLP